MTNSRSHPNSKVSRTIEKYDLGGMGEYLERAWTGEHGDRTSLRDLANEFNRAVLEAALVEATGSTTESDVTSAYRVLTDGDVSRADEMRKRRELEAAGLDVDELRSDFVTHQTIHTYLTEHREATLPEETDAVTERKVAMLERLQGRTAAVTESTLESLVSSDEITGHPYEVLVDVRVICEDCGSDYAVGDLLRQGGCDCGVGTEGNT
jgi:hypothetical protein